MVQMIVGAVIGAGTRVIGAMLGEKVIIKVFIVLGDRLLGSSKNKLVSEIWQPVKEALEKID